MKKRVRLFCIALFVSSLNVWHVQGVWAGAEEPIAQPIQRDWQVAEAKWGRFASEHLEKMREIEAKGQTTQSDREWVQMRGNLLTRLGVTQLP